MKPFYRTRVISDKLSSRYEVDFSFNLNFNSRYLVLLGLTDGIIYGTHKELFFEEFHEAILEINEKFYVSASAI